MVVVVVFWCHRGEVVVVIVVMAVVVCQCHRGGVVVIVMAVVSPT